MAEGDFEFSADLDDINRVDVLTDAANRLDRLYKTSLGPSEQDEPSRKSEYGDFARNLIMEEARLPSIPDVYKITDKDYLARGLPAPVRFTELSKKYDFYWIYFPVGLAPSHNWNFNRIEVRIEFNPDEPNAHLRPKAYQILPNKKFQSIISAHQHLKVDVDENFELSMKSGEIGGAVGPAEGRMDAGLKGLVDGGFGAVLGPFEYHIKRAKIDHNAIRMEWVFWRLDGVEFTQEDSPDLVVIAQVPRETKEVTIQGKLQAYHKFNFASATFQSAVSNLPQVLREYFGKGAPLADVKMWDITPLLK